MSYRRRVMQDARRSRLNRSRSEVPSFIRSTDGAVRQRPLVLRSVITLLRQRNARGLKDATRELPSFSPIAYSRKLFPCDTAEHDARVCTDPFEFIPVIKDHEEVVSRDS
jgi:hypothetical protein